MSGTTPVVAVYTVSDESRYLIVKNVPALGCIEELVKLFGSYGPIEEYRLMDEEDCEPYTDIYWIKFVKISNARFAKRKLDEFNFLGNLLQVTYAPMYESVMDTKDKLEERRGVLLNRIREHWEYPKQNLPQNRPTFLTTNSLKQTAQLPQPNTMTMEAREKLPPQTQFFPTVSMNATVQAVRQKLNQISQVGGEPPGTTLSKFSNTYTQKRQLDEHGHLFSIELNPSEKKPRTDGRRRI